MSARRKRGARSNPADPSKDAAEFARRMRVVGPQELSPRSLRLLLKLFMDAVDNEDRKDQKP